MQHSLQKIPDHVRSISDPTCVKADGLELVCLVMSSVQVEVTICNYNLIQVRFVRVCDHYLCLHQHILISKQTKKI